MRKLVLAWIEGGCDLKIGITLYLEHGDNAMFKRCLQANPRKYQRRLKYLLLRYAGVSCSSYTAHGQAVEKDGFRSMYPFLADPGIPNELKILATDKMSTYWGVVRLHEQLFECHTAIDCYETAKSLVEFFIEDRDIKRELDHFKEFGKPLGRHRIFNETRQIDAIRRMSIKELLKKEKRLRDNIWRINSELSKNDKPHLDKERRERLAQKENELELVLKMIG